MARLHALWRGGEIGWPREALAADRQLRETRLLRNQLVALAGGKPGPRDELPRFDEFFPLLADELGLVDRRNNAERLWAAFAALPAGDG